MQRSSPAQVGRESHRDLASIPFAQHHNLRTPISVPLASPAPDGPAGRHLPGVSKHQPREKVPEWHPHFVAHDGRYILFRLPRFAPNRSMLGYVVKPLPWRPEQAVAHAPNLGSWVGAEFVRREIAKA